MIKIVKRKNQRAKTTRTAKITTRDQARIRGIVVEGIIKGVIKKIGIVRLRIELPKPLIRCRLAKLLVWRLKQKIATNFHMMKKTQVLEVSDRRGICVNFEEEI